MFATATPRNSLRRPIGRPALLLLGIGALLVVGVFTAAAAAYAWPHDPWPPTRTTIVGEVGDFAPGTVTYLGDLGVVGYLARLEDGEFLAFDRHEPVYGCILLWARESAATFWDPCHGFQYDISGEPRGDNPILKPMDRFEVHVDPRGTIRVVQPVGAP